MTPHAMHGKVCLITGATAGIGKETALGLARLGATVVMVGRDATRGEAARDEIRAATGNASVDFLKADLSSQAAVRELAAEVLARYPRLDVLVNNAGAVFGHREVTVDGLERTFATNHMAYFLLTQLLLDRLRESAPSRIVNVASEAQRMGRLDFDDLHSERSYDVMRAYGTSKLANVMFTYELARRLEGTGVTANCLHPGVVASSFAGTTTGWFGRVAGLFYKTPFAISPEQGARTSIYLASSPEVEGVTGKYFDKCKEVPSVPASYDRVTAERLWAASEQLLKQPV